MAYSYQPALRKEKTPGQTKILKEHRPGWAVILAFPAVLALERWTQEDQELKTID